MLIAIIINDKNIPEGSFSDFPSELGINILSISGGQGISDQQNQMHKI